MIFFDTLTYAICALHWCSTMYTWHVCPTVANVNTNYPQVEVWLPALYYLYSSL